MTPNPGIIFYTLFHLSGGKDLSVYAGGRPSLLTLPPPSGIGSVKILPNNFLIVCIQ